MIIIKYLSFCCIVKTLIVIQLYCLHAVLIFLRHTTVFDIDRITATQNFGQSYTLIFIPQKNYELRNVRLIIVRFSTRKEVSVIKIPPRKVRAVTRNSSKSKTYLSMPTHLRIKANSNAMSLIPSYLPVAPPCPESIFI